MSAYHALGLASPKRPDRKHISCMGIHQDRVDHSRNALRHQYRIERMCRTERIPEARVAPVSTGKDFASMRTAVDRMTVRIDVKEPAWEEERSVKASVEHPAAVGFATV